MANWNKILDGKIINKHIMMKRNSYISLLLGGIMSLGLLACSDDSQKEDSENLSVVVFSPTRAVPGETVTIVGTGLDKVEAVTFLGDNRVTDIQITNENQIKAKLPTSLEASSGKVMVEAGGQTVTSSLDIVIVIPGITAYTPSEVQAGKELELSGTDLDRISEIVFPGNNVVKAIDFIRKSENVLRVNVPEDVPTCSESLTLVTVGGQSLTSPVMSFKEKPAGEWVDEETTIWDGGDSPITLDWGAGLNVQASWFNGGMEVDNVMTLYFTTLATSDNFIKIYDPNWVSITEINDVNNTGDTNAAREVSGLTELSFVIRSNYLPWFNKESGDALIITGSNVQLNKITWNHQVWKEN